MAEQFAGVRLEGARELSRSLRRADVQLARTVQKGFREAGKIVAEEARTLIRSEHLVASGTALRSVKVSVRGFEGFVRETATRDGFPYPRLRRFKGLVLEPALEKSLPAVEVQLEKAMDTLIQEAGL